MTTTTNPVGTDYTDIANRAQEITGRSIFPSTVKAILDVAGYNPPQPSASVGDNSICSPVSPEEEEAIDLAAGIAKVVLRLPIDLLGAIDHRAIQQGVVRNAYLREHLAVTHSDESALTTAEGGGGEVGNG